MDFFYSAASELRNDSDQSAFSKSFSYAIVGSWEWALTKKAICSYWNWNIFTQKQRE